MEARDLRAKLVRGRTQRIVGKMSVALGRRCRSMPEQSSHDLKAEAARNEMGCVGVSVVVSPVIGDAGSPHNLGPEFFDFAQRLAGLVSGKEEWGVGIAYLDDRRDERQRLGATAPDFWTAG
jgi:hypothetical protein